MAIDVTFPTINFPHRGEFERSAFVTAQETAQDLLADDFTTAIENFQTQANELETNVNNKEANVIEKHDIVVAKEALMSPHYTNIDIVAENIGTIGSKIGVTDINNATAKTTPVDADELAILDSANSFSLKKLTWGNLKNVLFGSPSFTGTPTAPTATAGTNTTQIATTAFVKAKSEADSIGVGQTLQDVTASRSAGVTYTNTTGKPIEVVIYFKASSASSISIGRFTLDGKAIESSHRGDAEGSTGRGIFAFIIPNNSTYMYLSINDAPLLLWLELR